MSNQWKMFVLAFVVSGVGLGLETAHPLWHPDPDLKQWSYAYVLWCWHLLA
jgi:hypothetical protein